jgi:hypothetical protein
MVLKFYSVNPCTWRTKVCEGKAPGCQHLTKGEVQLEEWKTSCKKLRFSSSDGIHWRLFLRKSTTKNHKKARLGAVYSSKENSRVAYLAPYQSYANLQTLVYKPSRSLHTSNVSVPGPLRHHFEPLKLLNFDFKRIQIQHLYLMRFRIQLPKIMRIVVDPDWTTMNKSI